MKAEKIWRVIIYIIFILKIEGCEGEVEESSRDILTLDSSGELTRDRREPETKDAGFVVQIGTSYISRKNNLGFAFVVAGVIVTERAVLVYYSKLITERNPNYKIRYGQQWTKWCHIESVRSQENATSLQRNVAIIFVKPIFVLDDFTRTMKICDNPIFLINDKFWLYSFICTEHNTGGCALILKHIDVQPMKLIAVNQLTTLRERLCPSVLRNLREHGFCAKFIKEGRKHSYRDLGAPLILKEPDSDSDCLAAMDSLHYTRCHTLNETCFTSLHAQEDWISKTIKQEEQERQVGQLGSESDSQSSASQMEQSAHQHQSSNIEPPLQTLPNNPPYKTNVQELSQNRLPNIHSTQQFSNTHYLLPMQQDSFSSPRAQLQQFLTAQAPPRRSVQIDSIQNRQPSYPPHQSQTPQGQTLLNLPSSTFQLQSQPNSGYNQPLNYQEQQSHLSQTCIFQTSQLDHTSLQYLQSQAESPQTEPMQFRPSQLAHLSIVAPQPQIPRYTYRGPPPILHVMQTHLPQNQISQIHPLGPLPPLQTIHCRYLPPGYPAFVVSQSQIPRNPYRAPPPNVHAMQTHLPQIQISQNHPLGPLLLLQTRHYGPPQTSYPFPPFFNCPSFTDPQNQDK